MHVAPLEFVAFVGSLCWAGTKWLGPAISELFRGGPRPPAHPIPGHDSRFLTRRRTRVN
jgi:hypothetical protein